MNAKPLLFPSLCLLALLGCDRQDASPTECGDYGVAGATAPAALTITYPQDETLFPPELAAPTFCWQDDAAGVDAWRIAFDFGDGEQNLEFSSHVAEWKPTDRDWAAIKTRSREHTTSVTIYGVAESDAERPLSAGEVAIRTSHDEVGAPLFFREVNLPFRVAVKDPAAHIRWRFGPISSKGPPPIVLEKLPVCGNCHSFSADGQTLAMEVDSGNDKASYAIAPIQQKMVLDPDTIITWADYRRQENDKTFGLLCQASPDGRYVVGTVKDRALAVYREELAFSQLFFLVKGVMAYYDRETKTFHGLPGADDPEYVQTNGTWSPDGETIVFARSHSKAYDPPSLRDIDSVLVPVEEAERFLEGDRTFLYDLYRLPFNDGRGGQAVPIEGASHNGMSNYFPKISPDGKWIVFCKARSFMLLQPDSELYIVPAEGGKARRLRCNLGRMNSWHSWSPNGKWLVFSSKADSVYTQLYLTHIDERGRSTPAVRLEGFTEPERAANIPEFVNTDPHAITRIREAFMDDTNYLRAGDAHRNQGDFASAISLYRKALFINPDNALVHTNWGSCLLSQGEPVQAREHFEAAIRLDPELPAAHCGLGIVHRELQDHDAALAALQTAVDLDPSSAASLLHLGALLVRRNECDRAVQHLAEAVRLTPGDPYARFNLAVAHQRCGDLDQATEHLRQVLEHQPDFVPALVSLAMIHATRPVTSERDGTEAVRNASAACQLTGFQHPEALHALAAGQALLGQWDDAIQTAERAVDTAHALGNAQLADSITGALEGYRRHQPLAP